MEGIRGRSGLTYALKYAAKVLKQGISMSKNEMFKIYGGKTPFIHSYSTFNRYMGVAKDFVKWAKEHDINRLDKVNYDVVREFLQEKIDRGLSEKTLKVNMSALEKFFDAVGRIDISDRLREDYHKIYSEGSPRGRALPFANPIGVINGLRDPAHKIVAEIQYLTGARIGDVKKIEIRGDKVIFQGSKGGRDRQLDFSDRPEKLERVKELHNKLKEYIQERGWNEIRRSYYDDLKNAVLKVGEVYTGAHAFRVTYAVERFKELRDKGLSEKEADRILTQELGHNRLKMSIYYRNL